MARDLPAATDKSVELRPRSGPEHANLRSRSCKEQRLNGFRPGAAIVAQRRDPHRPAEKKPTTRLRFPRAAPRCMRYSDRQDCWNAA